LGSLFKRLAHHAIPRRWRSVVEAFQYHVDTRPYRCAIARRNETVSYRRLDAAAEAFARVLSDHGVRSGSVVGVSLPSSIDLIVAIVAIAKAGGVYLPIDPGHPLDRVQFMLDRVQCRLLVTPPGSRLDAGVQGVTTIRPDYADDDATPSPPRQRRPRVEGGDTAYICFTSGSTGRPKGVPIRHESLVSLMEDIVPRFGIGRRTRGALNTSIGFDVSLAEIWAPLCGGGSLCVTDRSQPLVGAGLADFIASMTVTHLAVTPTVLRSMPVRELPSLHCIVAAGEACPPDLVAAWGATRAFFNAYGPTEATIYATAARCQPGAEVAIGAALGHIATHVLTEDLLPTPMGEVGELCLTGVGVSQGYLADADQPPGGFVCAALDGVATPIYRTGDLVRQRPDGDLIYVGRRDTQIKLLGNRIELEEIENAAVALEGVRDAAVCLDDREGRAEIVCFVTLVDSGAPETEQGLRERLAAWLPSSMLPQRIHIVDRMILTPSGKKDRKALLASRQPASAPRAEHAAARTEAEHKLVEIWERLFPVHAPVGVYDDFASLGGDSLKSLETIAEIETQFDLTVPPGHFGRLTTITNLAVLVDDLASGRNSGARADSASGFFASRLYRQQRHLTAAWAGDRVGDHSLVRSFGPETAEFDLFVCVQQEEETQNLAEHLGPGFRVHGMRSGHLVMAYTPDSIDALSSHYLREMEEIAPSGRLLLAGICQGGTIAHAVAKKLTGPRKPEQLILIEQARLPAYAGQVAFFFSEQSFLNPFSRFASGLERFDEIYGDHYTVDILPGPHGHFHRPPHVGDFVARLRARLEAPSGKAETAA
jgi:amino acid adenylation domain-containing protein